MRIPNLSRLLSALLTVILVATVAAGEAAAQDVRASVASALGPAAAGDWGQPALWMSTAALDQALASSFLSTQVGLSIVLPHQDVPAPPPVPVRTEHCQDRNCSPNRGCNSNCSDDCGHDTFLGKVVDPICFAGCEAGKVTCEAAKKAEHDACEIAKAIYRGFCDQKLGTLTLSGVSADAIVALTNLKLSTNLAERTASLAGDMGGKATIQGHLRFQPEPAVVPLAGCVVFDGWLPPQAADIRTNGIKVDGKLEIAPVVPQGSRFQVSLGLQPIDAHVTILGHPIVDVFTNNPLNFVTCPLLSLVGVAVDAFEHGYDFDSPISLPQPPPIVLGTIDVDPKLLSGVEPGGTGPFLALRRP